MTRSVTRLRRDGRWEDLERRRVVQRERLHEGRRAHRLRTALERGRSCIRRCRGSIFDDAVAGSPRRRSRSSRLLDLRDVRSSRRHDVLGPARTGTLDSSRFLSKGAVRGRVPRWPTPGGPLLRQWPPNSASARATRRRRRAGHRLKSDRDQSRRALAPHLQLSRFSRLFARRQGTDPRLAPLPPLKPQ